MMTKPEMILFDYGQTLVEELSWDWNVGLTNVLRHAVRNDHNLTGPELNARTHIIFDEINRLSREGGIEFSFCAFLRLLLEYNGIKTNLSDLENERIFWETTSPSRPMPEIDLLIDYLNSEGIRTGIISNMVYSSDLLYERANRYVPNNKFEFIIASSNYVFKKPSPVIFQLALNKAQLTADKVWYCGDSTHNDVRGAAAVGIYPVWFTNNNPGATTSYEGEYFHISKWSQLIEKLKTL